MTGSRHGRIGLGMVLAATLLVGCFSERGEVTGVTEGECAPLAADSEAFGSVIVAIRGFSYGPDTMRVAPGTRITWINCESEGTEAHTVTSDDDIWDSPLLDRGDTFSRTFDEPGTYPYHCKPHPFMQATVIVEE